MKTKSITLKILVLLIASFVITSCNKDDEIDDTTISRTVVIYMSGENNLGSKGYLANDYSEMLEGAKTLREDQCLLVYIDKSSSTEPPYIMKIDANGEQKVKQYDEDFYSSDPTKMKDILNWCYTNYPSQSYGLVLWGHANGWLCTTEKYSLSSAKSNNNIKLNAYGADTGTDNKTDNNGTKWMNIIKLADVISSLPHLDFIMSDCCHMQSAEVAYELKDQTDYLIGSPAEIPGNGAPYNYVVPDFFLEKDNIGKSIVDDYTKYGEFGSASGVPLSVIKTENMSALANATKEALDQIMPSYIYPENIPLDSLIYYQSDENLSKGAPIGYDIRNFMRHYLSTESFLTWDNVFKKTVVYSVHPSDIRETLKKDWMTNNTSGNDYGVDFFSFFLTDDNYGGLSMFIPQDIYNPQNGYSDNNTSYYINPNKAIYQMKWSEVINWAEWGWKNN